jgi:hypothetical protein
MSNEVSIFKNRDLAVVKKAPSALTQALMKNTTRIPRISPRNGMFKRIVGGDDVGKLKSPLRVVIVGVAPSVQRTFYIKSYDVNAEPTSPDCWTNDGQKPDASIKAPQGKNCETCPQNVKGSGQGDTRACRFKRRIAVVLPDDMEGNASGQVYQMELASKSIFGKGSNHLHPFNAYIDYVIANGEDIDGVITELSFNEDNDNQSVLFKAVDFVASHPALADVVAEAVSSPEAQKAVVLNVAAIDKGETDDEQFETAKPAAKPVEKEVGKPVAEPAKRASKKAAAEPTEAPKKDLADVLSAWSGDDDED